MTDQNGTVHEYDYDKLGRRTADRVVTVGTGIDDGVRRLETVYNNRQQIESQTSYDAPTGGTALNQVAYTYNAFGLPIRETQSAGAASANVIYVYENGATNTTRRLFLAYPTSSKQLQYQYGVDGSPSDLLSQVINIRNYPTFTDLVGYEYLGVGLIFRCDYFQPEVRWDLSPVGNTFTGLDSLGRVVNNLWWNYGASTDADRVRYTYDRNGNRTSRKNDVAASGNDELYRYDGLDRLTNLARGTLTDGAAPLTAPQAGETWRLDATGNWNGYQSANYTVPTDTVEQNRTANQANEITSIAADVGPVWAQPLYDRAGNMILLPQPKTPTAGYTATYDAWNRLVKLEEEAALVAEYRYDALTRRITVYDGTNVRRTYFSNGWQALEERLDDSTDPERQFVWGLRYIDDLVLRDRSAGGTLDERLYALQDANWNVTAVIDDDGDVQERYRYSAYGLPTFLNADFTPKTPNESDFEWETLYAGYRYDDDSGLYCVRYRYLHPTVGEWITRDPIEYFAGMNLTAYLSGCPLNGSDSRGLLFVGGQPEENKFFNRLRLALESNVGGKYAYRKIIDELQAHPKFKKLWDCLRKSKVAITLVVAPGLIVGTRVRFGTITGPFVSQDLTRLGLTINPTHPEAMANPIEVVDTLVHETIHAVIQVRKSDPKLKCECPDNLLDKTNDPVLAGLGSTLLPKNYSYTPEQRSHLESWYGDSASSPDNYIDIHYDAQRLVVDISEDVRHKTKLGLPTKTISNLD